MLLPSGSSSARYREVSLTAHLVGCGPSGAPSCACGPASQWRDSWFVTHDMTCVSPAEMLYLRRQSQSCSISLTIMCRRAASMTLVLTGACNGRETHPAGTQAILTQVNGPVWPKTRLLQMREDCRPRLRVSWSYCRHVVAGSLEGVLLVTEPGVVLPRIGLSTSSSMLRDTPSITTCWLAVSLSRLAVTVRSLAVLCRAYANERFRMTPWQLSISCRA